MTYHILLADDSKSIVDTILANIKQIPFKIHIDIVHDGFDAIQKTMKQHYDLILLDIAMPCIDGITAMEKIRTHEKSQQSDPTRIYAHTTQAISDHLPISPQKKFDAVIIKPATSADIIRLLSHSIE